MKNILSDNRKVFVFFLAISLLFFGNSVKNSYGFDDSYVTVTNFPVAGKKYEPNNPAVAKGLAGIPVIWQSRYGHGKGTAYDYRPVVTTLFAIEYAIFGQSPHMSHFINILLYAIVLFLLFLLLKKALSKYPFHETFALICCLLFAAHPLHTEVVDGLKSRDEILAFLFGLLTTMQVLKYLEFRKITHILLAALFLALGIFSKLSSLVFALLIPLVIVFFFQEKWRHAIVIFVGSFILNLLQRLLRNKVFLKEKEVRFTYHFENPLYTETVSFFTRVLFALKTLGTYIKLFFFPYPLRFYYGSAIFTTDISLFDAEVLIAVIFLILAGYYCYRYKDKIAFFGLLFFLISIAPFVNFILPVAGVVGERLAFVPSAGLVVFVVAVLFQFYKGRTIGFTWQLLSVKPFAYLSVALLVFLLYNWSRNAAWKDEMTLFERDAPHVKQSAGANNLIATKYLELLYSTHAPNMEQTLINKALEHCQLSIAADSSVYSALNNAGVVIYGFKRQPDLALTYFQAAVRINPNYPQAYENIGDCYFSLGKKQEAASAYRTAIVQNEFQYRSYLQLASILIDLKKYGEAIAYLEKASTRFPSSYTVSEKLGACYYLKGETQKGLDMLETSYAVHPDKELAALLSQYFAAAGQTDKSAHYLELAK